MMMGSLLTRTFVLALGYAYPAYECFKTVERNKPEIEQLRFWCQYWILVAALTIFERVGDTFISWLPMYSEAKLAFFIYLWYPKTRGTSYVYETFFQPYVAKHENEIDRNLLELRTRVGDVAILYWQKAATYGQTRFFEILQYVASQSQSQPSRPRSTQPWPQQSCPPPPVIPAHHPAVTQQQPQSPTPRQPPTPVKNQPEPAKEPVAAAPVASSVPAQTKTLGPSASNAEPADPSKTSEAEVVKIEVTGVSVTEDSSPSVKETVIEEDIRVTRGRLRKTRSTGQPTTPTRKHWSIWRVFD